MGKILDEKNMEVIIKKANRPIKITNRVLLILSLCYLYAPLLLFFLTWTKWWVFILSIIVSVAGCRGIIRDFEYGEEESVTVGLFPLAAVVFMLLGIGWLCGWTGDCPQAGDWSKHNAVLNDLVQNSWPVYYKEAVTPSMLTYYIGQYLIPGMAGKIASSFRVAEAAMYIWGEIGLFLVVFHLFRILKAFSAKKQIAAVVILIFFSGCLILAQQVYEAVRGIASSDMHWMTSTGNTLLQYRSNFVDLRWVMPQCLAVWIVIALWWGHRDKINDYASLMLPALLNGALSFLGLALIAVICAIAELLAGHMDVKEWLRKVFSVQNILSVFVSGGVLLLYYAGNVFYPKPDTVGFSFQRMDAVLYYLFVLAQFGVYCFLVWKENRGNGIFIGAVIALLIFPFIRMGLYNDFTMCCSIPGMFIVMVCIADYLLQFRKTAAAGGLIVLLFIGALNPLKEMGIVIRNYIPGEIQHYISIETLAAYSDLENEDIPLSWKYNYYSYNVSENIFIRYLAKDSWQKAGN